MKSGCSVEL